MSGRDGGTGEGAACPWCYYGDPHPTFSDCTPATSDADPASTSASEVEGLAEAEVAFIYDWAPSTSDRRAALANDLSDLLAAREAAAEIRGRAKALREVWHVTAHGGRSVDRVCDSLVTGKSVCDDLMAQLGGDIEIVDDWTNLNVPEAPARWVRYVRRNGGEVFEQSVGAIIVDTSGTWFRENTPAYRADSLAAPRGDGEGK